MPHATIIVPAFNSARTVADTLRSLQVQTFRDFEVIVINDGSTDNTPEKVAPFLKDRRIRMIDQPNRGLAGARNTGIFHSQGEFIGFCDADDQWKPGKLDAHVRHLTANPAVGASYSGSVFMDDNGQPLRLKQSPRLHDIDAALILTRNPVGNGSAVVLRRAALGAISFMPRNSQGGPWFFDETFRQSEDIECWMRLTLSTDWEFEGIPGHLTLYRVAGSGLSANVERQLGSWERMIDKLRPLQPELFARHEAAARAYQFRYLARRAVSAGDGTAAMKLIGQSLAISQRPLRDEPLRTLTTLAAATLLDRTGFEPMQLIRRLRSKTWKGTPVG